MTPDVRSHAAARAAGYEAEAVVAELTEVLEGQAAEITRLRRELAALRTERDRLETDLVLAQGWVKELAERLEESEARVREEPSPLRARLERAGQLPA